MTTKNFSISDIKRMKFSKHHNLRKKKDISNLLHKYGKILASTAAGILP